MDFSARRFIVAAGLTGMLALSVVGCGGSSSSSTSTTDSTSTSASASATDDTEASTDTSTSTDSSDTTKEDDPSEYTYYEIEALGFRCDLPDGFTFDEIETEIDRPGEAIQVFQYSDADGSNMNLQVTKVETDFDASTDEYLNECLDEAAKALEEIGATVNTKDIGTMQLSDGTSLPAINLTYKLNGVDLEATQAYYAKDGYLLTFTGTSQKSDVITTMFDSLTFK